MKKVLLISMLAAALSASGGMLPMDTMELRLGGKLDFSNAEGKTDWLLESGLGYFVFDNIAVGGLLDWGYDGNHMGLGLGGFGEYNFDLDSPVMPYIGLRIQYCFGDYYRNPAGHNYLLFEPAVGTKVFLSEYIAIYLELYYDLASEKAFIQDNKEKNYDIGLKTGLRCYF